MSYARFLTFLVLAGFLAPKELAAASEPDRDLFAAFYYPWYIAEEWENDWDAQPARPYGSNGARDLHLYGSDDANVFNRHLDWAEEYGIDVLVLSWMGPGSRSDINLREVLAKTETRNVKLAILYESWLTLGEPGRPIKAMDFSSASVRAKFFADLAYLKANYYQRYPSRFTIDGRTMLYLYLVRNYHHLPEGFVDQIRAALAPQSVYVVADLAYSGPTGHPLTSPNVYDSGPRKLLFDGYSAYNMYRYTVVSDGESALQYMMREAEPVFMNWAEEVPFHPHVLAAYKDYRAGHGRLVGSKNEFRESICRVLDLPVWGRFSEQYRRIVFITTFNEWYEGSAVEPGMSRRPGSRDYRFDYLEAIRDVARNGWCN